MRTSIWFANAVPLLQFHDSLYVRRVCVCVWNIQPMHRYLFSNARIAPNQQFAISLLQKPKINENWVTTCEIHFLPLPLILCIFGEHFSAMHQSQKLEIWTKQYGEKIFCKFFMTQYNFCAKTLNRNETHVVILMMIRRDFFFWWNALANSCCVFAFHVKTINSIV